MFKFKIVWRKRRLVRRPRKSNKKEYAVHRNAALALVHARLLHFNAFYRFKINRVSIKNQKTRWGSCSRKGNLNFNYRLVLLPTHLADYVIVHELCHLGEFNHSPNFWKLVARTIPNYKVIKREFKNIRIQ